jgi:hypothetical protein
MAWEWVAPVATATASTLVGLGGVFFTWRAGKDGREHAEHVAEQASTATLKREREARRAAAYLDILTTVFSMTAGITQITAVFKFAGEEDPTLPGLELQVAVSAKVELYGTQAVRDLYGEWFAHSKKLIDNHTYLHLTRDDPSPERVRSDVWKEQESERKAMREAVDRLKEQMNSELATLPHFPDSKAIEE